MKAGDLRCLLFIGCKIIIVADLELHSYIQIRTKEKTRCIEKERKQNKKKANGNG
jgi:hypothetical protein